MTGLITMTPVGPRRQVFPEATQSPLLVDRFGIPASSGSGRRGISAASATKAEGRGEPGRPRDRRLVLCQYQPPRQRVDPAAVSQNCSLTSGTPASSSA